MRWTKKVFLIFLILVFSLAPISALCTLTLDKDIYFNQETATATSSCSVPNEKNTAYNVSWRNASGFIVELDTGTTPTSVDTNFFQTYVVPSDYSTVYGSVLNATLEGVNLEGNDNASVSTAGVNDLLISGVTFTQNIFIERTAGVSFTLKDENDKLISNAKCDGILEDGNNFPLSSGAELTTRNGHGAFSRLIDHNTFEEGKEYLAIIQCSCGTNSTGTACFDEDGGEVIVSSGTISAPFSVNTWLSSATFVDKTDYAMKEEIFVCANVTNLLSANRIPLDIDYQVRCSSGIDNNADLDRILINENGLGDKRGISTNTTQMQCYRFVLPELDYIQGKTNQCYASTNVKAIDQNGDILASYTTNSAVFNITSKELNLLSSWRKKQDNTLNFILNLSDYSGISGTGRGDIHLKLHREYHTEDSLNMFNVYSIIKNVTIINTTGNLVDNLDFFLLHSSEDHFEIEIKNVSLVKGGNTWWNITLEFYNFEDRQADALEGIENKTGTFKLNVDCPSEIPRGRDMTCSIQAQIESGEQNKEVDFTCYVEDPDTKEQFSSTNFNQMVTQNAVTIERNFALSNSLDPKEYVLKCTANYFNLGSRTDGFSDSFRVISHTQQEEVTFFDSLTDGFVDLLEKAQKNVIPIIASFILFGLLLILIANRNNQKMGEVE